LKADSVFGLNLTDWQAIAAIVVAVVAIVALIFNLLLLWQTTRSARATESAARATDESVRVLRDNSQVQTFLDLLGRMEQTRDDRVAVRRFIISKRPLSKLSRQELNSVDAVCRSFDILAYFDHQKLIGAQFVEGFYADTFKDLYDNYLKSYVEELRKPDNRGPTHFRELVQVEESGGSQPIFSRYGAQGAEGAADIARATTAADTIAR
jgi:hypothetical protein